MPGHGDGTSQLRLCTYAPLWLERILSYTILDKLIRRSSAMDDDVGPLPNNQDFSIFNFAPVLVGINPAFTAVQPPSRMLLILRAL